MAIYALVMPILGLPVFLFAIVVFLVALDLISPETIPLATSPRSFSVAFWLFAHNLMEAMGIMTLGALYVLVPRYTRSGKLYSPRLAAVAMVLYTMAAIPAFSHHLYSWVTNSPQVFQNVSRSTSWATGFIAASSTGFDVGLTVWRHGLRIHPAPLLMLEGFLLYLIDGFVALELSTPAWNLRLHGTLYATAHTMTILTAVLLVFLGVMYHYYPALRDRQLDIRMGFWHSGLSFLAALAMFFSLLIAGVAGLPRRAYPWLSGEGTYAVPLLLFGLIFALAQFVFLWNLLRSERAAAWAPGLAAD
jgi:cytochrome c oxidase subunit 1